MRRRLLGGIAAFAMLAAVAAGPVAARDHEWSGEPGKANCTGQTTAYVAQYGGGVAHFAPTLFDSVREIKEMIREYCDG
jgi:hypothetical protein